VAALQSPMTALWTLVVFIVIQQIENLFLVPKVAGQSVKLHPALIMVALVVGNEAVGLWGMLLAVPLAAVIRDVFKYLYLRFSDEEIAPEEAMARVRTEKMSIEV
jgi:predicted PurR-regulated permease PerM